MTLNILTVIWGQARKSLWIETSIKIMVFAGASMVRLVRACGSKPLT